MKYEIIRIEETDSTNRWMSDYARAHPEVGEGTVPVVVADHQTAGRGQGTNVWTSNAGENLLFSVLLKPERLQAKDQFLVSMAISNALVRALDDYLMWTEIAIKWPNDIYMYNAFGMGRKLCGILIENRVQGGMVHESIIGVGLNVNQRSFPDDIPNPSSMVLADGRMGFARDHVLNRVLVELRDIITHWDAEAIRREYRRRLFWSDEAQSPLPPQHKEKRPGPYPFRDAEGRFMATLLTVEDDGRLVLRDTEGRERRYTFKEVEFLVLE